MKRARSDGSGLIASLLVASIVLAALLAWQAQTSMRYQRAAAEKVLRDFGMLAADEFARRTANEVGFNGFYPLATALRQSAAGELPAPAALSGSTDEYVRKAADLVRRTFRRDPGSGALEIRPDDASGPLRAWLSDRLARRLPLAPDRRYDTLHGDVEGVLHSVVFVPVGPGPNAAVVGFEAAPAALALRFQRARDRGPLFPQSLAHGAVGNDALTLSVLDPMGREVFRAGALHEPDLGVSRPFGTDYNAMLQGFVVRAAVDPAAAGALVIGGLPRSRLPFLLGVFAITAGLVLIAILQLNRERALARLRSEFVSRVSHELRTPLTQIRMFAETLLLERVRSDDERLRSLEIIDREARRLTHLVENILRFSRSERGEDRVEPRPFDVVPLVRQILVDFEPLAEGRARLVAALPDRAVANADPDALRQILLNLLDNALKYGPEGQTVRLAVVAGPRVSLRVEDEGPGIPAADRERVWERFFRLPRDRSSSVAGTGIGLAVVRDLVRLQGGSVRVESGAAGGARFVVELPPGEAIP